AEAADSRRTDQAVEDEECGRARQRVYDPVEAEPAAERPEGRAPPRQCRPRRRQPDLQLTEAERGACQGAQSPATDDRPVGADPPGERRGDSHDDGPARIVRGSTLRQPLL